MQAVGIGLAVLSASQTIRQANAKAAGLIGQAQAFEVQAQFDRVKAKQESLKHAAQAVAELENTIMNMARINAAAGAGNVDPFSGNPHGLKIRALDVGGTNYATAENNRQVEILLGEHAAQMNLYQASRARLAAKEVKKQGMFGALMTIGMAGFNMFASGAFSAAGGAAGGAGSFAGGSNLFGGYGQSNAILPGASANSFPRITF
jgi:hypothetical protein